MRTGMDKVGAKLEARHRPSGVNTHFVGDGLPFAEYVRHTQAMLRQVHCSSTPSHSKGEGWGEGALEKIVADNAPFELLPIGDFPKGRDKPYKRGVLLTHGLSDSPYHMRHLATFFQRNGFRVMAVLLPGHGTQPGDLLDVRWQEWTKAVRYGADCLAAEVDDLYLAGFSAGGALSVLQATHDERVRGLFLFSPALEITSRAAWANLHKLYSWLMPRTAWVSMMPDRDLYKYESFCRNAAAQMYALTRALSHREVDIPVFAVASADDATVHAAATLRFMQRVRHPCNKLVWYVQKRGQSPSDETTSHSTDVTTSHPTKQPKDDCKVVGYKPASGQVAGYPAGGGDGVGEGRLCINTERVNSYLPARRILSSAHTAIVIPPDDVHYGVNGEYANCLHYFPHDMENYAACLAQSRSVWLGEVNEQNLKHGLLRRLMYNPHYAAMESSMQRFIEGLP